MPTRCLLWWRSGVARMSNEDNSSVMILASPEKDQGLVGLQILHSAASPSRGMPLARPRTFAPKGLASSLRGAEGRIGTSLSEGPIATAAALSTAGTPDRTARGRGYRR